MDGSGSFITYCTTLNNVKKDNNDNTLYYDEYGYNEEGNLVQMGSGTVPVIFDVTKRTGVNYVNLSGIGGVNKQVYRYDSTNDRLIIQSNVTCGKVLPNACINTDGTFDDLKMVTLGASITEIGQNAFYNCSNIETLNLNDGTTIIGNHAFHYTGISSIPYFPSTVTYIGDYAFADTKIPNLTIGNSDTSVAFTVQPYAFYNTELTDVTIMPNVTNIGEYAFANNSELINVDFSGSSQLSVLGAGVFADCPQLKVVKNLHKTKVTTIPAELFMGDVTLASSTLDENNTETSTETDYLSSAANNDGKLSLPSGVTAIANDAFDGCTGLRWLNIPEGVTNLRNLDLSDCTNLKVL